MQYINVINGKTKNSCSCELCFKTPQDGWPRVPISQRSIISIHGGLRLNPIWNIRTLDMPILGISQFLSLLKFSVYHVIKKYWYWVKLCVVKYIQASVYCDFLFPFFSGCSLFPPNTGFNLPLHLLCDFAFPVNKGLAVSVLRFKATTCIVSDTFYSRVQVNSLNILIGLGKAAALRRVKPSKILVLSAFSVAFDVSWQNWEYNSIISFIKTSWTPKPFQSNHWILVPNQWN